MGVNDRFHAQWWPKLGLIALLTVCALILFHTSWLERWDNLFYDAQLASRSRAPADDLVIVAIDEQSLRELGRWPWSRRRHADLIRRLTAAGAKAIALDIIFAEPERADPGADLDLAAALVENGRVILPVLGEQARLDGPLMETLPIPILAEAAAGLGHVDVDLDADGIARSIYLKAGLDSPHWPTLALALLEVVDPTAGQVLPGCRTPTLRATSSDGWNTWKRDYHVLIPFAGPPGHFRRVSYSDVLQGRFAPAVFRDKLVLVGVTAAGLGDMLPTPVSGQAQPMSGVEFNANVLDALQRGLMIEPLSRRKSLWLTGLLVFLPLTFYTVCPPRWVLVLAGATLLLTLAVSFGLLHLFQRWLPPTAALLAQGLGCLLWIGWRWRQARRALFAEQARTQATLQSIDDAVIVTDLHGVVKSINPRAESLLDCAQTVTQGQPLGVIFRLAHDRDHRVPLDLVALCRQRNPAFQWSEEGFLANRSGQEYTVRAAATLIHDPQGKASGVVIVFSDITENRRLAQQMTYQATHDGLTQLPNRHLLQDRLLRALARARGARRICAVLCVNLDHFKKVNEGLGHAAGDTLLRAAATRLLACGRGEDTVARLSGDEFFIVLENLRQGHQAAAFARKALNVLAPCFEIDGQECFITASIGISLFPKDGDDTEALLKNANLAMHQAKDSGRDMIRFYSHDMHVRALDRLRLEQSLRHALERRELELYYQPQMDLEEGRIIGVEALLRWRHAQRGLISPVEFVPLAEETGLIEVIGEWVLRTACVQARAWQREGLAPLRMAVNLSPRQFLRPGLVDRIHHILRDTGLEPRYLDLEITEGVFMKDVEGCIATLHALKKIGVHLSIDDFGTGYSSLSYLRRFPIDQLKIDKSFVSDSVASQGDTAIAMAVIAMAHSMQLKVIAEGVENPAQLAFLQENQCDEIQGYYLSRPAPAQQIRALLRGESLSAALQDPNSRRSA